jgi:type I restriction enzyme S subunit
MRTLSDLCVFADGRVSVADLDLDSYISTENMLPTVAQTQTYRTKDVLISNIRPYFKKIWYADHDGGCSNDVLVLRAKENVYPNFLYYLLSDDAFFDYATATAKGTKMPRGDKGAIMRYEIPDLPLDTQIGIADTLSALDVRIAENKAINNHLTSPRSATDSSPDIKRGKSESRKEARYSL